MSRQLLSFRVRLALSGVSDAQSPKVVEDLQKELNMRAHLGNPQIHWDAEKHRIIAQANVRDIQADGAVEQMREEFYEIVAALVEDIEGLHIDALDVQTILQ